MNPDLNQYPARVSRSIAMELLCVRCHKMFSKIVAAHDSQRGLDETRKLAHKLPGETRAKYRLTAIALLLNPARATPANPPRRATRGEGNQS